MQSTCNQCHHASYLHDVWGICGVLGCEPCHLKLPCPRCKHWFGQHTVSDSIVFCGVRTCDHMTCYNKARPDKPLMKVSASLRPSVNPLPPARTQVTYEDSLASMLPAIYRKIVSRSTETVALPDPGVEKGFL